MRRADKPLIESVRELIRLIATSRGSERERARTELKNLVNLMAADPVPAYLPSFLLILEHCRYDEPTAVPVAQAIVALAEKHPRADYAAALPLLKAGLADLRAPFAFVALRQRLKQALPDALPLPAESPHTGEDLPIPAAEEEAP